ncbi:hypothetical protein ACHMW4_04090 [Mesorhizobium sp. UC22_110]|uniref:hypothetical protein n=1 Tax=unclassified Mesorhizobium TaxID=325217 RepID=UPI00366B4ECE
MSLDLHTDVEDLFRRKMMEFVQWCDGHWKITPTDKQTDDWVREKSPDYTEGYNSAIESLQGAFECWNEEFGG